jgi:hypothetical protein
VAPFSSGGDITPAQAPLVVRSLLSAGVDTTVHGLSAVLYAFATHPDRWARLRAEPGLARVAFDEAVRWESPVQTFFRTATADVQVGDVVVPDGRKILMFLAAANRDPRRWGDPDRFDLSRDPSGHVGFGFGLHQCVGQHVARLEAEALLTALAARVKRLELVGPTVRHHNNTLRAWDSLPVRAEPTRAAGRRRPPREPPAGTSRGGVVRRSVRGEGGVRGGRRPDQPDGDRRSNGDGTQDQQRGAQPAERPGQPQDDEGADELADEQRRGPDAGAAAALLEGERAQRPGPQGRQQQAVAEAREDGEGGHHGHVRGEGQADQADPGQPEGQGHGDPRAEPGQPAEQEGAHGGVQRGDGADRTDGAGGLDTDAVELGRCRAGDIRR